MEFLKATFELFQKYIVLLLLSLQAIDIFMSSCTVFVFLCLIEYAFVNVMMGDISDVERKDKTGDKNFNCGQSKTRCHN